MARPMRGFALCGAPAKLPGLANDFRIVGGAVGAHHREQIVELVREQLVVRPGFMPGLDRSGLGSRHVLLYTVAALQAGACGRQAQGEPRCAMMARWRQSEANTIRNSVRGEGLIQASIPDRTQTRSLKEPLCHGVRLRGCGLVTCGSIAQMSRPSPRIPALC